MFARYLNARMFAVALLWAIALSAASQSSVANKGEPGKAAAASPAPAAPAASAPQAPPVAFRSDANINNVTIGSLAAVQSQALASDAAKRAGLIPSGQAAPAAPAPAVMVQQKNAAVPVREARLVAILAHQGKVLYTEWEERGVVYQRGVSGDVVGWRIEDATASIVKLQSPKERRELAVGSSIQQLPPSGAKR